MYIWVCVLHIHVATTNKREARNSKESKEDYVGRF